MNFPNTASPEVLWELGMTAVHLMACALRDTPPMNPLPTDLERLYRFCQKHNITAMVAMALESHWKRNPPENPDVMAPWKQAKDKAIRKNILLNAERDRITGYLDSIGCWYLPLKGSFLQHDYPKFGMRQMSDNDILVDTSFREQISEFMHRSGYTTIEEGKANHDTYIKAPVYNFEIHHRLFSPVRYPELAAYYSDLSTRMIRDAENSRAYHLSDEDFYIYMTAHAYKHYVHGGIGIRTLVDLFVFLEKHGGRLDQNYVNAQLNKLGIAQFEAQCRELSCKLFRDPQGQLPLSDGEKKFLYLFFTAGTHGNVRQAVQNDLARLEGNPMDTNWAAICRYFLQRMFPPLSIMAVLDPELTRKKWKLPFAYIKRLLKALFRTPRRIIRELQALLAFRHTQK